MIKIFCEGIGDQLFIADFIEMFFNVTFERITISKEQLTIKDKNIEIIPIDGCKKIHNKVLKDKFINNTEIGGTNLLIFDADYEGVNGNNGFVNCQKMIENLKTNKESPIAFEHFLWPDNTNDGFFEDLLVKIIPEDKNQVINCIDSHLNCLSNLSSNLMIRVPGIKEKISFYLNTFQQPSNVSKRKYNNEFWMVDLEKSNELLKLKDFLSDHIC